MIVIKEHAGLRLARLQDSDKLGHCHGAAIMRLPPLDVLG